MHIVGIGILCIVAGCESFSSAKVDNPVMGPPPPRVSSAEELKQGSRQAIDQVSYLENSSEVTAGEDTAIDDRAIVPADFNATDEGVNFSLDNDTDIDSSGKASAAGQPVGFDDQSDAASIDLSDTYVVANVNGEPVFASDILNPHKPRLKQFAAKYSPEEIAELRQEIIRRELPRHVERAMLISALKEMLKPDQAKSFEAYLDQEFDNQLKRIQREVNAESKQEMERILHQQGTSLDALREDFRNQQMVMQYLTMKSQVKKDIGRTQLVEYYNAHIEDYAVPTRVKWKVIDVPYKSAGSRSAAREKILQAEAELKQGVPFAEVVEKYSSGPTVSRGGSWGDWTTQGSLADENLERLLWEAPVGVVTPPFEGKTSYQLVLVDERQEAGYRPFEELQDKIEKILRDEQTREIQTKVVEELRKNAHIETIFDQPGKPFLSIQSAVDAG